jgi:hypothetical protein
MSTISRFPVVSGMRTFPVMARNRSFYRPTSGELGIEVVTEEEGPFVPEVLPYQGWFPVQHTLSIDLVENEMGDGYRQTVFSGQVHKNADGMGQVTSHAGVNRFALSFGPELDDDGQFGQLGVQRRASILWDFFRDRLDNDNEPFYYYNPSEASVDLSGLSTVGRYLVKLEEPNSVLTREYIQASVFKFITIKLIEVRL